ncbi:hypothetical protein HMN09_00361000 [Mycena chlorophos]|uniref:Uncharacterized protein n=1 Tax=Mycena chlorophos TaxID=658473 RepID=A0A8H6WI52_MYCCL|nr:hypothetical protein HMN09_00361000 [Mycena chlorophos]
MYRHSITTTALLLSAAHFAAADAPPAQSSPTPQDPAYYYPPYTCPSGVDSYLWESNHNLIVDRPAHQYVECVWQGGNTDCTWNYNGELKTDTSSSYCLKSPIPWGAAPNCAFSLCPKYLYITGGPRAGTVQNLRSVYWENGDSVGTGFTNCQYDGNDLCWYNTRGDLIPGSSSTSDCAQTAISSCAVNRRRYRQEDNFTAMLRKRAASDEAVAPIRVAKARSL